MQNRYSDYDVMKMAAILNFNDHLLCIKISLTRGHFFKYEVQNVQSDSTVYLFLKNMEEPNEDVIKMATIFNLNENLFFQIISFIT